MPDHSFIAPLFLGAGGENHEVFERLLVDQLRDHVYWRRNFHPEDPATVTAAEQHEPAFVATIARTEQALRELSAALKRSTPLFSPRYVGHMASDLLMPGLLAQLTTTLYNPNNVSAEVAPVTLELELEVGRQLATMLGFAIDPKRQPCGHLTSGGTVANYEALWLARSARFHPLAVREALGARAARALGLADRDRAANFSIEQSCALRAAVADRGPAFDRRLEQARFETLGSAAFLARHELPPPVVIVPGTAHYSWAKAMQLLGLGTAQLWRAEVDRHMRVEPRSVRALLDRAHARGVPVLAVVGVLGTTEFGTIDPIHALVALRERSAARGQAFALHVDAAWGGYLATLFREPDGGLAPHAALRERFRYFPTRGVYDAFAALRDVDSVTVDPHKLGYLPYAAGAFVARDRRVTGFVGSRPVYLFDESVAPREPMQHLADYILEGSKPGAAAAAAYVTHRVLPLDRAHFGRLCAQTLDASEQFFDRLHALARRLEPVCRVALPIEPDTNLCCVALNPRGNRSLARANAFTRAVYASLAADNGQPVQTHEFLGSFTSLMRRNIRAGAARQVERTLDLAPRSFEPHVAGGADHVFLLRHTLMNPWLTHAGPDGANVLDRYCAFLERAIRAELERSAGAGARLRATRPARSPASGLLRRRRARAASRIDAGIRADDAPPRR